MLYRPALHGNWSALSIARRALKNKFPHANGSTHSCVAKWSGISAGPYIIFINVLCCHTVSECRGCGIEQGCRLVKRRLLAGSQQN
jgi:hypothetical protein